MAVLIMDISLKSFQVLEVTGSSSIKDSIQYGVKMIGVQSQWKETKGSNIKIAVVDTGIDFNHPDLKERIKGGINFTSDDQEDYMDALDLFFDALGNGATSYDETTWTEEENALVDGIANILNRAGVDIS
jgi:subtilisin family serine protease